MSYEIPFGEKQPNESRLYTFDFTANLADPETITGVTGFAADTAGLTIGTPVFQGKMVQCRISGGVSGVQYRLTVTVTTSDGNVLEGEADLFIREV